jgi:hypothetical protein
VSKVLVMNISLLIALDCLRLINSFFLQNKHLLLDLIFKYENLLRTQIKKQKFEVEFLIYYSTCLGLLGSTCGLIIFYQCKKCLTPVITMAILFSLQ